jgi:queuosine precursor transporter
VRGPQHWPTAQFLSVGTVNYAYKMLAAVAMIPMLYLVHAGVRRYLGRAEVERLRREAAQ